MRAGNFLEQLISEYYEFQGYFVRCNIRLGKRDRGGYDKEIDVLAYNPAENKIVHIETSSDSWSWEKRKEKFSKKFLKNKKDYFELIGVKDEDVKMEIEKIIILNSSVSSNIKEEFKKCGIKILSLQDFMEEIELLVSRRNPKNSAIPENFPTLRSIQMFYWNVVKHKEKK